MSLDRVSMDALFRALGWTLVHFLWQGSLIAVLLACLLSLLHRRSAQLRYAICCIAMIAMVAAPLITLRQLSHSSTHMSFMRVHAAPLGVLPVVPGKVLHVPPLHRILAAIDHGMPLLVVLWLVGVAVLFLRLIVGLVVARRMKRFGTIPISEEFEQLFQKLLRRLSITRSVKLVHSAMVQVPTVVGWLRPMILLPIGFVTGLSTAQIEAVLVHELAHIRRHDYLVSLLQVIAEAFLFYHPAVWWVSNRIRAEREHCCDDLAVATSGSAILYARALSILEEQRSNIPLIPLAANGGVLTMRIERILGLAKVPMLPQPAAALLLCALMATISFAAMSRAQSPVAFQAKTTIAGDASPLQGPYKAWLERDAYWIITPEERAAFLLRSSNPERDKFIQQFWLRRDPAGAAPNAYRAEHYRRVAYADQHFGGKTPGWETDRGRAYILFGKPSSIDAYPSGSASSAKPFEVWNYVSATNSVQSLELRFVDVCRCGEYELVDSPVR